ncbi:MAG: tetratricopeptide repeat protein [Acidobacteriota bacterium]
MPPLVALLACAAFLAASPASDDPPQRRLDALRREAAGARPPAPRAMSDRLTGIGDEFLREGKFAEAIELFSEALGLDPENGRAIAQLVVAYLDTGDLEFADFYLEQATASVRRRQPPPEVFRTIGDLFESHHRMTEAVAAWDYFRRLKGSDPAVEKKLDRARAELSLGVPQRVRTSDRISLYTDASVPDSVAARVEEYLESELAKLSAFFSSPDEGATHVVILYEGRAYFSLVSIPNWVSGIFDGKIRVSTESPVRWSTELAGVLSHELAHSYLRSVSRGHAPAWLHEGLGQWFQAQRIPREDLRRWFARHEVLSLEQMEALLAGRADRERTRNVYLEALGLTEFLIGENGSGAMACLVRDLGDGVPFEEALRRETGLTSRELVSRWKGAMTVPRG